MHLTDSIIITNLFFEKYKCMRLIARLYGSYITTSMMRKMQMPSHWGEFEGIKDIVSGSY